MSNLSRRSGAAKADFLAFAVVPKIELVAERTVRIPPIITATCSPKFHVPNTSATFAPTSRSARAELSTSNFRSARLKRLFAGEKLFTESADRVEVLADGERNAPAPRFSQK